MRFILITLFYVFTIYAHNHSMRDCMLLPITDSVGNTLGSRVFDEIEDYLKDKRWCEYKSNANLIEVFSRYREGLRDHLQDPKVIKTVADRMSVGTIIRIDIEHELNQTRLKLDVLGETGEDVYFSESRVMLKASANSIVSTLRGWLEIYKKSIPYDGKVLGVLGDQVTFTISGQENISIGQEFRINRYKSKEKHPLLKKVVDWRTDLVARGKVASVSKTQVLGVVRIYEKGDQRVKAGDWIELEPESDSLPSSLEKQSLGDKSRFGKLGFIALSIDLSSSQVGTNTNSKNKASNFRYGFNIQTEAWITREYFAIGEFSRRLGNLSKDSGNFESDNISYTNGVAKVGGGYKYLPMGFFFGPQIDIYGGYAIYSYNLEESRDDGLGENSIKGYFLGLGGNMPLQHGLRIFGAAEFMPFPTFEDESSFFKSARNVNSLMIKAGVKYQVSELITIDGAFESQNNSAKFKSGNTSEINYTDNILRIGGSFIF